MSDVPESDAPESDARESGAPSERTRVKRYHRLAHYDSATIHAVLDAMPVCNVAYVHEGRPIVTPTLQWRDGDRIYWHGSAASRMIRAVAGQEVCVTVSLIDGLVLARSAYNYNINHRSVMIFGKAEVVTDPDQKKAQLQRFVDGLIPGQWDRLRPVKAQELKATTVLSLPITEASAKVRTGQPEDEAEDYAFPAWAGVVPVRLVVDPPVADPRNLPGVEMPPEVRAFKIG
ncbi:pyridoxamine 5'-phosphate oxidase family protein [Xanthobacter agilis]|uniref:Nitroimidazol reductase NimA-like FMN-containing flavoprotein (Pyridoxamine 5'-phosphate oxidase superfamily) n=1 Tax=Xanthobacter agilis TaxID=47492 RepID=A0ABU0L8H9_XANAG|nr:pyridoxamine 5'-phosphate oxidase family protein [Xanthobacter agilis]MDQ0503444.1 nitroimidazol reductase NimA-like FMN-containing flavoprotein (pyridoxamine 5'-phosphate oxidase superfamily) [Xanthobacter agilis]